MENYLDDHNMISKAPMDLVMFRFAIEHISRICRVLRQPNGHALLVGIGGSGRASAAKLASFISDYDLFQIEISKNYTTAEWREDVKKMFRKAGYEGASTMFLFGDHQIKVCVWHCSDSQQMSCNILPTHWSYPTYPSYPTYTYPILSYPILSYLPTYAYISYPNYL